MASQGEQMQIPVPLVSLITWCLLPPYAEEPREIPADVDRRTVYRELVKELSKVDDARAARMELDYWHRQPGSALNPPLHKSVKTKDGKSAEIILLKPPALSMPGVDFSM